MALVLDQVTYTYKAGTPYAHTALLEVSVSIELGEFVAIIGATGSGKSTLVQHFNGLLKPGRGQVLLNGKDINTKQNIKWARQKVGLVFQYPEHQLFEETIYKDIAYGPNNAGCSAEEIEKRVRYAMELVGLNYGELKDRSPFDLSGGQMRRVAIAGVLAMKPEIIVLDEPTAGLDPRGRNEIMEQIVRLHREEGLTVVLVSHNMEDVARLAQRVLVMHRSKLVMQGTPHEVFARGQQLKEMGLDIPQVTHLLLGLRKRGKPVRTDLVTLTEVKNELLQMLRGKTNVK